MTTGRRSYDTLVGLAVAGRLVIIAPGTMDGEPVCAWIAARLDGESAATSRHPEDHVRVGQMIGATRVVREHYQPLGFQPN